jgi:outer membrane protein TolC
MTRNCLLTLLVVVFATTAHAQPAPVRLSLADAVTRGLENSHRIAEAKAREEGAKAAATSAGLANKPIVGASASYTRTNHVEEFSFPRPDGTRLVVYPDIPDNVMSRVSFQWPIFTSGRTDALERAAEAEAQAAGADIETARADLRFEITRAYWAAVTAREAERVLEESQVRAEAQLKDARQRFDVGLIPPNEVSSLEAQRSRERAQLLEAANQRDAALVELRRLTGVDPEAVIELTDRVENSALTPKQYNVTGLMGDALDKRPELKALASRLSGAESRLRAAASGNKPTVNLLGGVDYANPNPRIFPRKGEWQPSWDVGVNVNWNFIDFGRTRAQMAEVSASIKAAHERIAETESIISADVRQRFLDMDSAMQVVRATDDAIKSATEARRVVSDRFSAGVATSTDVIVAQVALLETELARTRALANLRLAEARLERSLGGW